MTNFVLIGREKLNAVRAAIRIIDKLDMATSVREQKKEEATILAGALLDAEARIGEILSARPITDRSHRGGTSKPLPEGITRNQSSQFQLLAENKEIIEKVKAEAEENDDLPTRTEVLRQIKECEKNNRRKAEAAAGAGASLPAQIDLRHGDFTKVLADIPPVNLILTDPPYPKEFLPLWSNLADFAAEKLSPGGTLVAYSGQLHLPEALERLSKRLVYVWTFCLYHEGFTQIVNGVNVICRWKPVLIFRKTRAKFPKTIQDYVVSERGPEKTQHDWQQNISAVKRFVGLFSKPGEIICDPFSGAGTTAMACKELGRNFTGAEIDEEAFNISKERLK